MASSTVSVVLSLFLLLLTQANSANIQSFSFKNFNSPSFILQGDATVSSGKLQLTKVKENGFPLRFPSGRAFYSSPIQIYDKFTGAVASWATSFTVKISAPSKASFADGIAFALVPVGSEPRRNGGYLGVFDSDVYNNSAQTVAVEFDTLSNSGWDPSMKHIGIDVNSIKSIATVSWDLANGENAEILITYNAATSLLVVSLVHPSRRTSYILSERVDITNELPEYVGVGFSATTGLSEGYIETHDVLSWSFASRLPDDSTAEPLDLARYLVRNVL
nr:lectin subunit I precursor [Vigna cylindrica]